MLVTPVVLMLVAGDRRRRLDRLQRRARRGGAHRDRASASAVRARSQDRRLEAERDDLQQQVATLEREAQIEREAAERSRSRWSACKTSAWS